MRKIPATEPREGESANIDATHAASKCRPPPSPTAASASSRTSLGGGEGDGGYDVMFADGGDGEVVFTNGGGGEVVFTGGGGGGDVTFAGGDEVVVWQPAPSYPVLHVHEHDPAVPFTVPPFMQYRMPSVPVLVESVEA